MHRLSDYVGRPPAVLASRSARPTPAAGPLPPGFIDTGDLMPSHGAQPTRVDVESAGYRDALHAATSRTIQAALPREGFTVGREPAIKEPARTVYLTLPRPISCWNTQWAELVARVDAMLSPDWVVARTGSAADDAAPVIIWALLVPADLVVYTQDRIRETLELTRGARCIWAEATPRTIGREGP